MHAFLSRPVRPACGIVLAIVLLLSGSATYIPPGAKADLQVFAPPSIQDAFAVKATAPFPAAIAAVRIQGPAYSNHNVRQNGGLHGDGRYTVVMTREVEDQIHFDRIAALPKVSGVNALNRMLIPARLEGEREIRGAAARLHADLVWVYTFDTAFFDHDAAKPLSVITSACRRRAGSWR
jgi:hypothetical protein